MTHHYGIDTSVFMRLLTGLPELDYQKSLHALEQRQRAEPKTEYFVSNQVIGEAYIALQHHFSIPKAEAKAAMGEVLTSGLCSPLNGTPVLEALKTEKGCGLLDRLIANDYASQGLKTLTHDAKMARLTQAEKL